MALASIEVKLKNFLLKTKLINPIERIGLAIPLNTTWNLIRRPKLLAGQIDVLKDYRSYKQSYNFLAEGSHLADPDKRVLLVSLTD